MFNLELSATREKKALSQQGVRVAITVTPCLQEWDKHGGHYRKTMG